MKHNKVGVIFMVSMLALAGIGITYAGWTDLITVSGTVQNGDVDINVRGYSGTWVWKTISDHGIVNEHALATYGIDEDGKGNNYDDHASSYWTDSNAMLVARCWAEPGTTDDSVKITFKNLFPCQTFIADFIIHYEGSIPGRVYGSQNIVTKNVVDGIQWTAQYGGSNWMEDLWFCKLQAPTEEFGIWLEHWSLKNVQKDTNDMVTYYELDQQIDNGYQMHECDYVVVLVKIHIPQNNAYQSCSGDFYINYGAIQYDEYTDDLPDTIIPTI